MKDSTRWIVCLTVAAGCLAHLTIGCGALLGIEAGTLDAGGGGGGQGATGGSPGDGGASSGGSGSIGSGGRGGEPPESCVVGSDCGMDGECGSWSCDAGRCVLAAEPPRTVVMEQTAGDCKQNECDGMGGIVVADDDADLPIDNNDCTQDVCSGGNPSNPNSPMATPCGANMTLECDGNGNCEGCTTANDCGVSTICVTHVCEQNGTCTVDNAVSGTSCGACKVCQSGLCQNAANGSDPNDDCDGGGGVEVCNASGACQCSDGLTNWGEANPDCGGPCPKCPLGSPCGAASTCQSNICKDLVCCNAVCNGVCEGCDGAMPGTCSAILAGQDPSDECPGSDTCNGNEVCFCDDGIQNNGEGGVDCGGQCGMCSPSCSNSMQDQMETAIDCGGPVCPGCPAGETCLQGSDCLSGVCTGPPGVCCDPEPESTTCGSACDVVLSNNCGQPVSCICQGGFTCIGNQCTMCLANCNFSTCGDTFDTCNNPIQCPCCGLNAPCDWDGDCCVGLVCLGNQCQPMSSVSSSGIASSSSAGGAGGGGGVGGASSGSPASAGVGGTGN